MLDIPLDERPSKFIDFLLKLECGTGSSKDSIININNDRGGRTRFGITENTLKSYAPNLSLYTLTREQAIDFYIKFFYNKVKPDPIAITHYHYFDISVNSGYGAYRICFKETLGDLNKVIEWRKNKYTRIVEKNPSQKVFLKGWLNRIDRVNNYFKFI